MPATDLSAALARYALRLHREAADTSPHHVVSPLGAWLLLALCATAGDDAARAGLAEVLGVDVDVAAATAADLLDRGHPAVLAAAAAWLRPDRAGPGLTGW